MEFIVLGVVASVFVASWALWKKTRSPSGAGVPADESSIKGQLTSGERTIHNLQVSDIVTHLGSDFLVEGVLTLDDDGAVTRMYRMTDGAKVRWLVARPGDGNPLLLEEKAELAVDASGPEAISHGGVPYRLAARASVRVVRSGALASSRTTDRARLYEYASAGEARIIALAWPDTERADATIGERLSLGSFDILPGR